MKKLLVFFLLAALLLSAGCAPSQPAAPGGTAGTAASTAAETTVTAAVTQAGTGAVTETGTEIETEPETEPETEAGTEEALTEPDFPPDTPENLAAEPPSDPAVRAAYDAVLAQYRQALSDPDFTAEAYPLVDADTVTRLAARWSGYADDESALFASYLDIDGGGVPELIVSRFFPSYSQYEPGLICAIYTWNGAEAVELLRTVDFARDDLVRIYSSGIVLCVKDGFYRSPAQVMKYRLDPAACALRKLGEWTYSSAEDGSHSFENADGRLDPAAFYADCGTVVTCPDWWVDTPFASNPGTAAQGAVVDLEDVPQGQWERRLPRITLKGRVFDEYNEALEAKYVAPLRADPEYKYQSLDYGWTLNGDVLCVWVCLCYGGYQYPEDVCAFSVSEDRQLTHAELLAASGVTQDAFDAWFGPAVRGAFYRWFEYNHWCDPDGPFAISDEEYRTVAASRIASRRERAIPVLDRDGRLACLAGVTSLAGGGEPYCWMLPVLP